MPVEELLTTRTLQTVTLVEAIWTVILSVTELVRGDAEVDSGPRTQHLRAVAGRWGDLAIKRWLRALL